MIDTVLETTTPAVVTDPCPVLATTTLTEVDPRARHGAIRQADRAARLVSDAIGQLLEVVGAPDPEDDPEPGAVTGVVVVSPRAARRSAAALSPDARTVSPTRFAAANAGSLAAVSCIEHGLRGPSLMLSMPTAPGRELAATVAAAWLRGGSCRRVVIASHDDDAGPEVVHATLRGLR